MTASGAGGLTRVVRTGARAGAAVVVLGLSLAAPQAVGVASADSGAGDGGSTPSGHATAAQDSPGAAQSSSPRGPRDVVGGRSGPSSRSRGEGRGSGQPATPAPASAVADVSARHPRAGAAPAAGLDAPASIDAVVTGAARTDPPRGAVPVPGPAAGVRRTATAADSRTTVAGLPQAAPAAAVSVTPAAAAASAASAEAPSASPAVVTPSVTPAAAVKAPGLRFLRPVVVINTVFDELYRCCWCAACLCCR
jgi:hypothetical protein